MEFEIKPANARQAAPCSLDDSNGDTRPGSGRGVQGQDAGVLSELPRGDSEGTALKGASTGGSERLRFPPVAALLQAAALPGRTFSGVMKSEKDPEEEESILEPK